MLQLFRSQSLRKDLSLLTTAFLLFTPQYPSLSISPSVSASNAIPSHSTSNAASLPLLSWGTFSAQGSRRPRLLHPHLPSSLPTHLKLPELSSSALRPLLGSAPRSPESQVLPSRPLSSAQAPAHTACTLACTQAHLPALARGLLTRPHLGTHLHS